MELGHPAIPLCPLVSLRHTANVQHDWQRLAKRIANRRVQLGFSKREAIRRSGLSSTTWLKVENDAEPIADSTWSGVEIALQWEPGSVAAVLDGGDETPMPTPASTTEQIDELFRRIERLESRVRDLE